MPYSIEAHCERMLAIRISTPVSSDEISAFSVLLNHTVSQIKGGSITCVDVRQAELFSPTLTTQHRELMRQLNEHLLRSAFWVAGDGLYARQIERMVREADNPKRRVMRQRHEIELWLGEIASPEEKRALHAYLFGQAARIAQSQR